MGFTPDAPEGKTVFCQKVLELNMRTKQQHTGARRLTGVTRSLGSATPLKPTGWCPNFPPLLYIEKKFLKKAVNKCGEEVISLVKAAQAPGKCEVFLLFVKKKSDLACLAVFT